MKSALFAFAAVAFSVSSAFAGDCNILNPVPVDRWECGTHISLPYTHLVPPVKVATVTVSPTAEDRAVEYLSETLAEVGQRYIEDRISGFEPE